MSETCHPPVPSEAPALDDIARWLAVWHTAPTATSLSRATEPPLVDAIQLDQEVVVYGETVQVSWRTSNCDWVALRLPGESEPQTYSPEDRVVFTATATGPVAVEAHNHRTDEPTLARSRPLRVLRAPQPRFVSYPAPLDVPVPGAETIHELTRGLAGSWSALGDLPLMTPTGLPVTDLTRDLRAELDRVTAGLWADVADIGASLAAVVADATRLPPGLSVVQPQSSH
jgi:hypothetical protein